MFKFDSSFVWPKELNLYRVLIIQAGAKHNALYYKSSESQSKDIYLYLNNDHFTLLEPTDSTTIEDLLSADASLEPRDKRIYMVVNDSPECISSSVLYETCKFGSDVDLVEENESEAKSDEIFKNKATNGKNYPHLYMMSTFSHLLYNIRAVFAREITGRIFFKVLNKFN